ncbi:hypothetical protein B0H13DRAFT_2352857 [Mycena leptocephala]|nr:hypothetical protein B0H13DRAFT_2352857 [Mycena leptocephala]
MTSSTLLHSPKANSVQFSYCFDRPLQCIATRYINDLADSHSNVGSTACLVFAGGISLSQDTWIPIIKELFRLSSSESHEVKVHSAWVIERPNHGEPALINAELLKTHYSVQFPSLQYATAIHAFLASNILSTPERNNLVGIGHSGGGGSLIQALECGVRAGNPIPLKSLILVESPLIGPEAWPFFKELYDGVKRSNARRITSWPSKKDAMEWFKTRLPWKTFSPDVLQIIEDTYFISDPERRGYITTKTSVEQETACFVDNGTQLEATPFLLTIIDSLPTHVILGSKCDLWPPVVYDLIDRNNRRFRAQLASLTVIDDVGHYLPAVKPRDTAAQIFRNLQNHQANLSKL